MPLSGQMHPATLHVIFCCSCCPLSLRWHRQLRAWSLRHAYPKPCASLASALRGRYLENVPAIVPLLEKEYRNAAQRLTATQEELKDLAPDK